MELIENWNFNLFFSFSATPSHPLFHFAWGFGLVMNCDSVFSLIFSFRQWAVRWVWFTLLCHSMLAGVCSAVVPPDCLQKLQDAFVGSWIFFKEFILIPAQPDWQAIIFWEPIQEYWLAYLTYSSKIVFLWICLPAVALLPLYHSSGQSFKVHFVTGSISSHCLTLFSMCQGFFPGPELKNWSARRLVWWCCQPHMLCSWMEMFDGFHTSQQCPQFHLVGCRVLMQPLMHEIACVACTQVQWVCLTSYLWGCGHLYWNDRYGIVLLWLFLWAHQTCDWCSLVFVRHLHLLHVALQCVCPWSFGPIQGELDAVCCCALFQTLQWVNQVHHQHVDLCNCFSWVIQSLPMTKTYMLSNCPSTPPLDPAKWPLLSNGWKHKPVLSTTMLKAVHHVVLFKSSSCHEFGE